MADERVALVTGASSGIGRAIARRFGRKGMRVALLARRMSRLEEVAEEIRKGGGQGLPLVADVSVSGEVEKAVDAVVERWGRIDILVNNAGIGEAGPVEDVSDDSLHRQFAVNVFGPFYATRAVVPHMKRQGGGQIINIGSVVGLVGLKNMSVYAATKWALRGLNESWREELYSHGIKAAYVAPGYVITEFGGRKEEDYESPEAEWALRPDDVAHVVESIVDQGPNSDIKEVVVQVLDRS
jgi:NAD(P)-dependent dehydrogenase (short-subunit alcohol dehydrogenase family)